MIKHRVKSILVYVILSLSQIRFWINNRKLLAQISHKSNQGQLTPVYFVVTQMDIWLNTKLFHSLNATKRLDCTVLLFPDFESTPDHYAKSVSEKEDDCIRLGLKFINCWDNSLNQVAIHPSMLQTGFIFYEQPLKLLCEKWDVKAVVKNHLILYFPYGMLLANLPRLHYRLDFYFYCYRISVESIPRKILFALHSPFLLPKTRLTGFPKSEVIFSTPSKEVGEESFSCTWAPHWSVSPSSLISVSSFLEISNNIVDIALANPDIQFNFRPHPRLKHELEQQITEGSKLSEFIEKWNQLPNTSVITGSEYTYELRKSDLLITDSISFLYEFLSTEKPIIITTPKINQNFNALGKLIASVSYRVVDARNIEHQIHRIRAGHDPLLNRRIRILGMLQRLTVRNSNNKISFQILEELDRYKL
jgi:hypothetical protein